MDFLGRFHPQLVHAPIVLLIVAALLDLAGRAMDREWFRKAGFLLLVLGAIAAVAAVWSGSLAAEVAASRHGVPDAPIEAHEWVARLATYLALAAVLARSLAGRLGGARKAVDRLGLVLHLAAAILVGVAAHRGGILVFQHAAGVHVHGQPVISGPLHEHD